MAGKPRGFAALSPERRAEISRLGGQRAHAVGKAHKFTPDEARFAGRRGGETVSKDREHMRTIGKLGAAVSAGVRRRDAETPDTGQG